MKGYHIIITCFIMFLPSLVRGQQRLNKAEKGFPPTDFRTLISHADLIYHEPVTRSEAGMPVGNGRMGSLVWTTPSAVHLQINRNDIFGNNSSSDNFYQRNTDYCGGAGFVDIDFGENVFNGKNFLEKLSCYDGLITVEGKNITAEILAANHPDVMAIKIYDKRLSEKWTEINLRMLRDPVQQRGNHQAISKISANKDMIALTQRFTEDNYYCSSAVVISVEGGEARAEVANQTTVKLLIKHSNTPFTIYIASTAGFDPNEDIISKSTKELDEAKKEGFERVEAFNERWWHHFWQKGYVQLHSLDGVADDVEKNYTYYLYVMASSSRGKYPVKFNGMLWTTGGDTRQWGGLYWGANQSCLYNALFASDRLSLLQPMFDMYTGMYKRCAIAAKQEWGSKGIYIPETVGFDGPPPLPDSIAEEMKALYLMKKPWKEHTQAFWDYAYTKLPFLSRWNWKKDGGWHEGRWKVLTKDSSAFGHTTHILARGAKIAYKYWLYYEYTMDTAWLRRYGYPVIKGISEFYRNFPNVKKDADGKYHIYNVNDNESVWGGQNTAEEISAMHGIFPVVIKAAEILDTDKNMIPVWKEFLTNLSPLSVNIDYPGYIKSNNEVTWIKALPPIVKGNGQGLPDANTMPMWYFDLCNRGADDSVLKIANDTYNAYFSNGIHKNTYVGVLSRLPVAGVLLGRTEVTKYLIPNQIHTGEAKILPNRMDEREGKQTTNVERLGRAAEALQDALVQSIPSAPGKDPVIYVFPAWPKSWDAQFELLCRGNFLVTSSMKNGQIQFVEINSHSGGECKLFNPWNGSKVCIYKNDTLWKETKQTLIVFNTDKGDRFKIIKY